MKFYTGDIFDSKTKFIAHQVNCMGDMNSGIAKQIRQKYPNVFEEYLNHVLLSLSYVGDCLNVLCPDGRIISNLYCPYSYGYDNKVYTNYEFLREAMRKLASIMKPDDSISFPYKMSCDRGGGDWTIVFEYISDIFKNFNVEIWRLPKIGE